MFILSKRYRVLRIDKELHAQERYLGLFWFDWGAYSNAADAIERIEFLKKKQKSKQDKEVIGYY